MELKSFRKLTAAVLCSCLFLAATPALAAEEVQVITLSSQENGEGYAHVATWNGDPVPEYDYAWHADPSRDHGEVKNSPAEYYTGTEPSGEAAVYIAHDIVYYPELEESKFQLVNYDGEQEWVYPYEAPGYEKYLFSTLPVQGQSLPTQMMHSEAEAWDNAVLHITKPGTYRLEGQWHGQIWVDLGDEDKVYADSTQKVTLILGGVDITCTVAPGVVFASVYECDNAWEDAESYSHRVDTADAGANVVLEAGTVNNVTGTNVFRILKTKYKDEDSMVAYPAQKKAWKIDGAFYSYQSMNIAGEGTLNITAGFEGLDTEHHLTLNGGNVNIYSQDDGINVNEDGVSVLTVNGGSLHICAGLGNEGDGIDSNGFLVINGGTVISSASPMADSGLDSDCGSFVNGGTVVALGSAMDWVEPDGTSPSAQPVLNLRLSGAQSADEAIVITKQDGTPVFAYDPDKDEVTGENQRSYSGAIISSPNLAVGSTYNIYIGGDVAGTEVSGVYQQIQGFQGGTLQCFSGNEVGGFGGGRPGGMERPEGGQKPEGMEPPQGMGQPPEGFAPGQIGGFPGNMNGQGATCTFETDFVLSQQVNAFSGVADYSHAIVKVEASDPSYGQNGCREHYACSGCGQLFADEAGTQQLSEKDVQIPGSDYTWFIAALVFCGVAVLTAGILIFRKKK